MHGLCELNRRHFTFVVPVRSMPYELVLCPCRSWQFSSWVLTTSRQGAGNTFANLLPLQARALGTSCGDIVNRPLDNSARILSEEHYGRQTQASKIALSICQPSPEGSIGRSD